MTNIPSSHLRRLDWKIKETHSYARVSMQMLVAWFTFFGTVNYATLGWLARPEKDAVLDVGLAHVIAFIFIIQNIFGIICCLACKCYIRKSHQRIAGWEKNLLDLKLPSSVSWYATGSGIPVSLHSLTIWLMVAALITLIGAWVYFATSRIHPS